jgi:hypothetical protein
LRWRLRLPEPGPEQKNWETREESADSGRIGRIGRRLEKNGEIARNWEIAEELEDSGRT